MPRAADALNRGRNRFGRIELADELDRADVDAEFERRGRDDRLQLAALEPLLGQQPLGAREAAVMGHHSIGAEPLLQIDRDALGRMRRLSVKTSVVRCSPIRRATSSYIASQCGWVASGPSSGPGRDDLQIHRARAIVGANDFDRDAASASPSRVTSAPARNSASFSIGFSVADSPIRLGRARRGS